MIENIIDKLIINRKNIKNISIRIRDGKVLVSVPKQVKDKEVFKILEKHRQWIEEKLSEKRELRIEELVNKTNIKEGEFIPFLGEIYIVVINEKSNGGVILKGGEIIINCYKKENAMEILRKFYIDNINKVLIEALEEMSNLTKLKYNRVAIKFMKTRWGSCNSIKRYINLNAELISKRYEAIKYVTLHELCHLVYPNHSKDFYELVYRYMEAFREEEKYLNKK